MLDRSPAAVEQAVHPYVAQVQVGPRVGVDELNGAAGDGDVAVGLDLQAMQDAAWRIDARHGGRDELAFRFGLATRVGIDEAIGQQAVERAGSWLETAVSIATSSSRSCARVIRHEG